MTALLYYSYSTNLTKDDLVKIDEKVFRNREFFYRFTTKLYSNTKRKKPKIKRVIIVVCLKLVLVFSTVQPVDAIGVAVQPAPVVKVQPNYHHTYEVKVAPRVNPRLDKVKFIKSSELPLWIYMIDEQVIRTSEISKLIKKLRGGDMIETAAILILIVVMSQIMEVGIEGFQFQLPIVNQNGAVHRPANGGIQQHINNPKHGGRITVRMSTSNQGSAAQSQVDGFVKNGKVDLRQCYDEVMRRAKSLNCENWSCDFERFKSLATENGIVSDGSAREAISVLNGEMLGFYKNAERVYYGKGVYGPDFKVIGQGPYSHITHVEIKNPVGSAIEKASRDGDSNLVKQGNKIGIKISKQQTKWANETFRKTLSHINPNAIFPQSPSNTLGLVDEFDVPIFEKMTVQNAVKNSCINPSNVVFINNEINI